VCVRVWRGEAGVEGVEGADGQNRGEISETDGCERGKPGARSMTQHSGDEPRSIHCREEELMRGRCVGRPGPG